MSTQTDTGYDMVISGTIAGLLKVRRSTVDQLADLTGITRATLYRKLRDGRWNANETGMIADQFNVDVTDLYHGHITVGPPLGTVTREYRATRPLYGLAA